MDPVKTQEYLLQQKFRRDGTSVTRASSDSGAAAPYYASQTGEHSESSGFKVVAPWFYGLGVLAAFAGFLGISISENRALENQKAWERYAQERQKDGLAPILGYQDGSRPPETYPVRFR